MRLVWRSVMAAAVGGTFAMAGGAVAQQSKADAEQCEELINKPDQAIEVCTRAIDSGQWQERALAVILFHRGTAWLNKRDNDKAITDFDASTRADAQFVPAFVNRAAAWINKGDLEKAITNLNSAISLEPRNAASFYGRARVWLLRGEANRALADLDATLRLDPNFAPAYYARGRTRYYKTQFAEAVPDLSKFFGIAKNPFTMIWSYLAKARMGQDGRTDLDQALSVLQPNQWPAPLIQMFQGTLDQQGVVAAIAKSDAAIRNDLTCEAAFYFGEQAQLQGRKDEAGRSFKRATEICPKGFVEFEGAVAELRNLAK